jgi:hypothetical protein
MGPNLAEQLCLSCGLCCNGVIFADVELQPGDTPDFLAPGGIVLRKKRGKSCFHQPCAALENGQCRVYENRPKHCRDFDCALLKNLNSGSVDFSTAQRAVRSAKKRAEKVQRLLRALGDNDESLALSVRFRRTSRRVQESELTAKAAEFFGQLSIAMHDLNFFLSRTFYPGE